MLQVPVLLLAVTAAFALDLCSNQSNVTEYRYHNQPVQNCNCTQKKTCIRKCCAVGFIASKRVCIKHADPDFALAIPVYDGTTFVRQFTADSHILAGVMNCDFFPFFKTEEDWFFMQEDGKILTSLYGTLSNDYYCVDHLKDKGLAAFICYDTGQGITSRKVYALGMIISMPFLLATFIAYALLPARNLHMKALMFYVISLMMSYLLLVIVQLSNTKFSDLACATIGYLCMLFFLISFFWINVICIDIWFTFSGRRGFSGRMKEVAERKRFYLYCIYALGVPIVHVSIMKIIDSTMNPNSVWRPGIGDGQCFIKRGYPELLYFYGPMGVLISINIILFSITAIKIKTIKKDTSMLKKEDSKRHSYENDKQTFNLYLKLLFAMGINWSMEIISWAVVWAGQAPDYIWYFTDFCNAIYGVFIFFIFVFKRSTWKLLKRRYYSFIGKPHLAHSLTMTNTTRVTYSTSNTASVHEHNHHIPNDTSTLTSEA